MAHVASFLRYPVSLSLGWQLGIKPTDIRIIPPKIVTNLRGDKSINAPNKHKLLTRKGPPNQSQPVQPFCHQTLIIFKPWEYSCIHASRTLIININTMIKVVISPASKPHTRIRGGKLAPRHEPRQNIKTFYCEWQLNFFCWHCRLSPLPQANVKRMDNGRSPYLPRFHSHILPIQFDERPWNHCVWTISFFSLVNFITCFFN